MATLEVTHHGSIAEVLINRPEKKNALEDADFVFFTKIARDLAAGAARCIVIRGAAGTFCSGRDIAATNVLSTDAQTLITEQINPLFLALRAIPIPTIAVVEGHCLGGGFGIAFACDIILATEEARFGSPFRNIGCLPDSGAHFHLADRIGYHRACELLFTGRLISGREAADVGLINRAYPSDQLSLAAQEMASLIATGPTVAFRMSKKILQEQPSFQAVLEAEAIGQREIFKTSDAVEGLTAFQQKRKPTFSGA
jgi:enoyl-CoA hydratase/carnithine racemase